MTITIDLPDEVHRRLEKQGQGRTVAAVIARLIEEVEAAHLAAAFERLRAAGLLLPKQPAPPEAAEPFQRIKVQGKPVSEVIIEERRRRKKCRNRTYRHSR